MTSLEISKIKQYQDEFYKIFRRRLEIDWRAMNGMRRLTTFRHVKDDIIDPNELIKQCAEKYGASVTKIRSRKARLQKGGNERERRAVEDFSKIVVQSRINVGEAAKAINRDRTLIYYYAYEK